MQQLGHDLDQEEPRSYRHPHVGSPVANSPPGTSVGTSFCIMLSPCILESIPCIYKNLFVSNPCGRGMGSGSL